MVKENMYTVFSIPANSPKELETILNKMCEEDSMRLVAVDNGYYIFESNKKQHLSRS